MKEKRGRSMIIEYVLHKQNDFNLDNVASTKHTAGETFNLSKQKFDEHIFSRHADIIGSQNRAILPPLKFLLRG